MFGFVIFILSLFGWRILANDYQTMGGPVGHSIGSMKSLRMNGINYNNIVNVRVGEDGLYFSMPFIFRLFHPPLLIPWNEIARVKRKNVLFSQYWKLYIGRSQSVAISIPNRWFGDLERFIPREAMADAQR